MPAKAKAAPRKLKDPCADLRRELRACKKELKEAHAQQAAVSEILRVISSSPTGTQPVFDAIVKTGVHLFGGTYVGLRLVKGEHTELAASTHDLGSDAHPLALTDIHAPVIRAILRRTAIQVPDVADDELLSDSYKERAERRGYRAILCAPMLRNDEVVGAINVMRAKPGLFPASQVALLRTFADQAVIAIENARLFDETKEALERQTATAEVLRVISSSPGNLEPVYRTILEGIGRLCEANIEALFLYDGEVLTAVASNGTTAEFAAYLARMRARPSHETTTRLAALERRVVQVTDLLADKTFAPNPRDLYERENVRTVLSVPMLREGALVGVITAWRREVRAFSDRQVDLVKTFADQAVIAIENVRLFNETKEALERQTATAEILRVISESPTDVGPVFQSIAERAARICDATNARIWLSEGDKLRCTCEIGGLPGTGVGDLLPLDRGWPTGRAVIDCTVTHVEDVAALPPDEYPIARELQQKFGHRTILAVPLMRDKQALGAILLRRLDIRPFDEKQIALLKTFADQAVIAIENVRLFKELEARNAELTESLERQTATSEILRVISSSPTDTQPVFDAILASAARLCGAETGILFRHDNGVNHAIATRIPDPTFAALFKNPRRPAPDGMNGIARLARELRPVHIPDLLGDLAGAHDPLRKQFIAAGVRTWLGAPMLKDGRLIGAIVLYRNEQRAFSDQQIALLQTFADQAVIAIENVRLFNELQAKNADLTEALEQQTATSDILRVMSNSPTDVQPVFEAIASSAARLCEAELSAVYRYDGKLIHAVANTLRSKEQRSVFERLYPMPPGRGTPVARAILERRTQHVPDTSDDAEYVATLVRAGFRSALAVPMRREGTPIGAIAVGRVQVREFTDAQINLLQTFADQAVIAIENVRLFNETNEALEQQTVISEILRVISSSPTDTQPVFDAIVKAGVPLFGGMQITLRLIKGDFSELVASTGETFLLGGTNPTPLDDESHPGARAIRRREIVQVPDLLATDAWVSPNFRKRSELGGFRAIMGAPLLRNNVAIGAITVTRATPGLFNEKQIALLKTFADQAVIAIENVRLFKELEARNAEITEALERQTATSEVLKVISRSAFDLQPVLETVVESATRLCGATRGHIFRFDGELLRFAAAYGAWPGFAEYLEQHPARPGTGSVAGRAALERRTVHVPDVLQEPEYAYGELLKQQDYRAVLAVPMLRENTLLGVIAILKSSPEPFRDKQIELVTSFADQAVIAIENVRLFNEIQEKSHQLEVANRHKSQFLANMSHELRTPLNCINGFSEMLLARMFGELNEKQEEFLRDINTSGEHLLALINDVLDLSKIEAGRMDLYLTSFDPGITLDNTVMLIKERAARRGIAVDLSVDDRLEQWVGDERKIRQVVLNLLSNAIKFTPEGGRIDVKAMRENGEMVVAVSDTGVGIKPEDQERIFEEFQQAGSDYTKKAEGTGLGLALSRRFVELHGGTLRVESVEGKGSTFTFRLPQKQEP
jgi:GAF domain-containing protein/anti-sigma regulatory factor (Ser/Thr protein kinase)